MRQATMSKSGPNLSQGSLSLFYKPWSFVGGEVGSEVLNAKPHQDSLLPIPSA